MPSIFPKRVPALLALADGTVFRGVSFGAETERVGEVVFNTAMTGYQEILTDPSYSQQLVTLTYPHIGNTGINEVDAESSQVHAAGLIVRCATEGSRQWRATRSLGDYLRGAGIPAISDIDTRKLTRILREHGAQNGCLVAGAAATDEAAAIQSTSFVAFGHSLFVGWQTSRREGVLIVLLPASLGTGRQIQTDKWHIPFFPNK